jgi:hypothetical protein
MEVNAKDWMDDIDKQATENALQIALLKMKVEANHEAVMKNSDVRLEAIMERFDRLDAGGWKLWSKLGTLVVVVSTAVWFTVVEPMQADIAIIERRLLDADRDRGAVVSSEPE